MSQFDGPVTFNENVRLANQNKRLDVTGEIKVASTGNIRVHNETNSTSTTTGSIVTLGGVGIGKSMNIGGDIVGLNTPDIVGFGSITAVSFFGDGAGLTNTGAQLTESTSSPFASDERVVLTDKTSGTMTTAKTDAQLTFNFSNNRLTCGGGFVGDLIGNADSATTSANLSFGSANQVVFKNSSNDGATSANLTFDGTTLTGTALEIKLNDGKQIVFGTNNDFTIAHDDTNGGINCGKGDLIINAGGNNGDGVIIQTGTTHIAKFEKHSSTGKGGFELLYDGDTRIISQSWGVEIKNGELRCNDDIVAFNLSDINLKENITVIPNALDKINSLSGNTFTWKEDGTPSINHRRGMQDIGVIAQEVEALGIVGLTTTRDNGTKAVRYDRLIPILIQAVKELSAKVTALEGS